jgi:hypothetical protein
MNWYVRAAIDPLTAGPDAFIDRVLRELDWSGGDGDGYRSYAEDELKTEDINQIDARAREIAKEEIREKYWQVAPFLRGLPEPIDAYRCITLKPVQRGYKGLLQQIQTERLGVYWSYDENAAEAHWGYSGGRSAFVTLHAKIPKQFIDWETTLILNLQPNCIGDEKELRVIEGSPIVVDQIEHPTRGYIKVNLIGKA